MKSIAWIVFLASFYAAGLYSETEPLHIAGHPAQIEKIGRTEDGSDIIRICGVARVFERRGGGPYNFGSLEHLFEGPEGSETLSMYTLSAHDDVEFIAGQKKARIAKDLMDKFDMLEDGTKVCIVAKFQDKRKTKGATTSVLYPMRLYVGATFDEENEIKIDYPETWWDKVRVEAKARRLKEVPVGGQLRPNFPAPFGGLGRPAQSDPILVRDAKKGIVWAVETEDGTFYMLFTRGADPYFRGPISLNEVVAYVPATEEQIRRMQEEQSREDRELEKESKLTHAEQQQLEERRDLLIVPDMKKILAFQRKLIDGP